MKRFLTIAILAASISSLQAADRPAPLKVLLVAGGCCHDYAIQKETLKKGLEERANVKVDIAYTPDKSTSPPLPILGNPEYAKGYDLVIHDECAAAISDPTVIAGVLKPHDDGIPGVNLHCAMHCYRIGNPNDPKKAGDVDARWFEYLGLQSSGHGPQKPIDLTFIDQASPIEKGFQNWTTINEELYNNIQLFPTAHPLVKGHQIQPQKDGKPDEEKEFVVGWTNLYHGKTRVFSTTIGHNNDTVADARYLDFVTRGALWAMDKINDDGTPKAGYGPAK
jgi:hypothetical protein